MPWLVLVTMFLCALVSATERDDTKRCREVFVSPSSEIEEPISVEDSQIFHRIVLNCLDDHGNNEVLYSMRALAEYDWSKKFVRSPAYVSELKLVLYDAWIKHKTHGEELPQKEHVERAYDRFLAHQLLMRAQGSFFQKSLYCQAASDAAVYFLRTQAFGLVQKYDGNLDDFECENEFHSWHQAEKMEKKIRKAP